MGYLTNVFSWFVQGGLVMYPLLACSILVVAIAVERYLYYRRHCGQIRIFVNLIEDTVGSANWTELEKRCGENNNILSRILAAGLPHRSCIRNMKDSFENMMAAETTGLRKNLSYLDTVVTMAPLLGLLGTVLGMIGSFQVMDLAGSNPSAITGSVGEALIATASGLCVAVLALIVHSYFSHRLDGAVTRMEHVCIYILEKNKGELL